jgi:antitoxin ParD1/3/4
MASPTSARTTSGAPARNTSVNLTERHARFIADQVAAGHYASNSEVIREGLRLLEDRQIRLAALRAALQEGEDSGDYGEIDFKAFIVENRVATHP